MVAKATYDWKITLKKMLKATAYVFIAGLISIWQDDPVYMGLIPILMGIENWLKNKDKK